MLCVIEVFELVYDVCEVVDESAEYLGLVSYFSQ